MESSRTIAVIRSFYESAAARVKASDKLTNSYDISEGVLQGESLSPFLFSLFLADIDEVFYKAGLSGLPVDALYNVCLLLYADDLVLLADSPVKLQKMLNTLENYANQICLTINSEKN